jgi:drug/metabolite transporter (DMT)-like permease
MSAPASNTREIKPVAASLFMLGACSMFAFNSIFVKLAADTGLHPFQIAFFRNFFALLIILPMVLATSGIGVLRPNRPGMLALRGVLNGSSMMCWFYAVPLMAITDLTAIGFTGPIWATLLAALILGEKMRLRRWTAIFVGILGALIVVRPGFQEVNSAVYLVLFSSATWGATLIVIRRLTSVEHINTILVYQAIMMAAIAFVPMLFVWQTPTWEGWAWMGGLGVLAMGAHSLHVRAFSMQEVSALQPLDFARFPISAVGAFLLLGEILSPWTALGAFIVFAAGMYISHREAQVHRRERAAALAAASETDEDTDSIEALEPEIPPPIVRPATFATSAPIIAGSVIGRRNRVYPKPGAGGAWGPGPHYLYTTAWGRAAPGLPPRKKRRWAKSK